LHISAVVIIDAANTGLGTNIAGRRSATAVVVVLALNANVFGERASGFARGVAISIMLANLSGGEYASKIRGTFGEFQLRASPLRNRAVRIIVAFHTATTFNSAARGTKIEDTLVIRGTKVDTGSGNRVAVQVSGRTRRSIVVAADGSS